MLKYAGVDLLLEDADGELSDWLSRRYCVEELNLFGSSPMATMTPIRGPRSVCCISLGVPLVNYPAAPPLKLNTLWWPTGATRWARGLFLVDDERLQEILKEVKGPREAEYLPKQLVIADSGWNEDEDEITEDYWSHDADGARVALSTKMYMLHPRPISNVAGAENLWLLPLVDERYWWQWRTLETFDPQTWEEAFTDIKDALGLTNDILYSDISSAWGFPDPTETHRDHQNPAVLLDALARSIGRRVVRTIDDYVELIDWDDAADRLEENLAGEEEDIDNADPGFVPYKEVCGGEWGTDLPIVHAPGTIKIVMREEDRADLHAIEELAEDYDIEESIPEAVRTIFSCNRDNFTSGVGGDEPREGTTDLAERIATAEFAWLEKQYDRRFLGMKAWWHTGYDDFAEWSLGKRLPNGDYDATTRVVTLPHDVGIDLFLGHANVTGTVPDEDCACDDPEEQVWEGVLAEALDPSSANGTSPTTALMTVYDSSVTEWGPQDGRNEEQRLTIYGSPTGGTISVRFEGSAAEDINWDDDATAVQAVLESLTTIGAGNVTCTGGPLPDTAIDIEFVGDLTEVDVDTIVVSNNGLTGGNSPRAVCRTIVQGRGSIIVTNRDDQLAGNVGDYVQAHRQQNGERRIIWISCRPQNEVQTVTITGTPTGGTFTLKIWGLTTGNINYNANAAAVQSALEAILGTGNATVTGGALPGTAVSVTFAGDYANTNVPLMTSSSALTGGTAPAVEIAVDTQGCCS